MAPEAPPLKIQPPAGSPPGSPKGGRRGSSTPLSTKRVRLSFSTSWKQEIPNLQLLTDNDRESSAGAASSPSGGGAPEEQEDEPTFQLSYFPLLHETLEEKEFEDHEEAEDDKDEKDRDDDMTVSSDATLPGSIDSYHSASGAGGIWEDVPMGPPDAILGIAQAYRACSEPNKVNVCVGAYRDQHGKPWVLPSVRAAEKKLWEDCEIKEYLPIEGDPEFVQKAMQFAYGEDIDMDHIAAIQTLSGTGACRIGGTFLAQFWPKNPIYVPNPTWGNHIAIFKNAGLKVKQYRYYDKTSNSLNIEGMLADIFNAPDGSIILLHACAHNPTGCDPTIEQWKQIVSLISEKEHVAFFDSAYQGFASGDAEHDASPFRYAVSQRVPILLSQSFAKNFGLYGERVGTLSVVCGDAMQKERILSELKLIVRPMYSSPPRHGSSIVKTVLQNEQLKAQYYDECASMARRIQTMRSRLVQALKEAGSTHDWSHIERQIGMFAFTGLSEDMCRRLTNEFFIFLTLNGRISIAGLNDSNVEYVAKAIHEVSAGQSIAG